MEERARQGPGEGCQGNTKALGEEELSPSYSDLCTVLMMVADVVNELPVALRYPVDDDFMPLVSSTPLGGTPEALPETRAAQVKQRLRVGGFQQDLMNTFWKLWKEQ